MSIDVQPELLNSFSRAFCAQTPAEWKGRYTWVTEYLDPGEAVPFLINRRRLSLPFHVLQSKKPSSFAHQPCMAHNYNCQDHKGGHGCQFHGLLRLGQCEEKGASR